MSAIDLLPNCAVRALLACYAQFHQSQHGGESGMQPDDPAEVEAQFWPKFRRVATRLPFSSDLLAAYYAAVDPITPTHVRGVLLGALAYFILPTDLVPDFILGLGFTDDAAVLAAAVKTLSGHIQPAHKHRARQTLDSINTEGERE